MQNTAYTPAEKGLIEKLNIKSSGLIYRNTGIQLKHTHFNALKTNTHTSKHISNHNITNKTHPFPNVCLLIYHVFIFFFKIPFYLSMLFLFIYFFLSQAHLRQDFILFQSMSGQRTLATKSEGSILENVSQQNLPVVIKLTSN